jgi:hypothetical protein
MPSSKASIQASCLPPSPRELLAARLGQPHGCRAAVIVHRHRTRIPSSTSRSTMPVTLPLETLSTLDSSLIFKPCSMVQRRHHVEARQRGVETGAEILAQLGLDMLGCLEKLQPKTQSRL